MGNPDLHPAEPPVASAPPLSQAPSGRHGGVFRTVFALALAGALLIASVWILRPFLPAIVWATMIAVATWPLLLALQRLWRGRRLPAVVTLSLLLVLAVAIPVTLAVQSVAAHSDELTAFVKTLDSPELGLPPPWLRRVPLVGESLVERWRDAASDPELARRITPYAAAAAKWLAAQVGLAGLILVQVLLTILLSAVLFAKGELVADGVLRFARRIAPESGESSVHLAAQAIRGVALGVVVTALAQAVLGGLGLLVAGVPGAALLTVLMFVLAVAQVGATPVIAVAALWKLSEGDTTVGLALLGWAAVVGMLDNVIRPILIRRGVNLPLPLIFAGVVGGLLAFGIAGLFIGPVVLAVTWTLMKSWVNEVPDGAAAATTTTAVAAKAAEQVQTSATVTAGAS